MDFSTYICEVKNSTTQKISSKIIDLDYWFMMLKGFILKEFSPQNVLYMFSSVL